jgi:hypothetical protein
VRGKQGWIGEYQAIAEILATNKDNQCSNLYDTVSAERLNLVDQRLERNGGKHLKAPLLVLSNEQMQVSGLGGTKM